MADSIYNKQVNSKNSVNLSNISFNQSNIASYHKNIDSGASSGTRTSRTTNITLNLDELLTDNIDETITAQDVTSILDKVKNVIEDIDSVIKSTKATMAVAATSILSGVLDVGEAILDGGTWAFSKVVGLFSPDTEEAMKEFIARDLVSEANEAFYENTELGRFINDASYMKYDSKAAQGIREASEKVTVLAAATAATVCTGGAYGVAAATTTTVSLGFAYGTGNKAEDIYSTTGANTSWKEETSILLKGLGEAANWYAQGKLGEGLTKLLEVAKKIGLSTTLKALGNVAKNTISTITKNGFKKTVGSIISNSSWSSMIATDNIMDSIGIIGDNVSDWLVGDEEFNLTNALLAGGELIATWTLNSIFDGATKYLEKIHSSNVAVDLDITQPLPVLDDTIEKLEITEEIDVSEIRKEIQATSSLQENISQIRDISEKNAQKMKKEILSTVDGIEDPVLKAKKLYNELSKRVNYNIEYMDLATSQVLPSTAVDIYTQKLSFDTLDSDQVICKGWSELYTELLEAAGFDSSQISILGNQKIGSHKWVAIDMGNQYSIIADATNAINGKPDLYSAKMGLTTKGFIVVPNDILGTSAASPVNFYRQNASNINYLASMEQYIKNIDSALGYPTESSLDFERLRRAKSVFGNSGLVEEVIGAKLESNVALEILNNSIPNNSGLDGLEAYIYYRDMIRNVLGPNYNGDISTHLYRSTSDSVSEALSVIRIQTDNGPLFKAYSKSGGNIVIDTIEKFNEFISLYTRVK